MQKLDNCAKTTARYNRTQVSDYAISPETDIVFLPQKPNYLKSVRILKQVRVSTIVLEGHRNRNARSCRYVSFCQQWSWQRVQKKK